MAETNCWARYRSCDGFWVWKVHSTGGRNRGLVGFGGGRWGSEKNRVCVWGGGRRWWWRGLGPVPGHFSCFVAIQLGSLVPPGGREINSDICTFVPLSASEGFNFHKEASRSTNRAERWGVGFLPLRSPCGSRRDHGAHPFRMLEKENEGQGLSIQAKEE